MVKLSPT
ncbi:hypothetical protein VTH06DRAFT_4760 [Thermothelomyces fergusii]